MTEIKKRPYKKMQIEKVSLIPEEAVLGGCKTGNEVGPLTSCSVPSACSSDIS